MKAGTKSRLKKGGAVAAAAIALVGAWEGLKLVTYRDIVGVPTVCYGETRGVTMGDRYTKAECDEMLREALIDFERDGLRRCVKPEQLAKVPDDAYNAFLSLSYNVGTGAFCRSTLVKKLNRGDVRGACNELPKWVKAGGRTVRGLVNRRKDEQRICLASLK